MRRLSLVRETLTELSAGELALVAGGALPTLHSPCLTGPAPSTPLTDCLTLVTK